MLRGQIEEARHQLESLQQQQRNSTATSTGDRW
jgi:hypothetical protein